MDDSSKDLLQAYIARLLEIQDNPDDHWLDESDLQAVAEELGLTQKQRSVIQKRVDGHLTRARQFADTGLLDEAIEEFRQASALRPLDSELLVQMANVYSRRYQASGNPTDRDQALGYARRALQVDPDTTDAYTLIKTLKEAPETSTPSGDLDPLQKLSSDARQVRPVVWFALIIFGLMGLFWIFADENDPEASRRPLSGETQPGTEARPGTVDAPVTFAESTHGPIKLLPQSSELSRYQKSYSYTFSGELVSDSAEWFMVTMRLELLDESGKVYLTEFKDVLRSSEPSARVGDHIPVDWLVFQKTDAPESVTARFSIERGESEIVNQGYVESPVVEVDSLETFVAPGALTVRIRETRVNRYNNDGYLTLELENTGDRSIRGLDLRIDWKENGNLLATTTNTWISESRPYLPPGGKRVRRFAGKFQDRFERMPPFSVTLLGIR